MDQSQFDALTKGLASGANRRRVLGGLAGAAAVLGLGGLTALEADAKGNCNGKNKKRCGGKCVRIKKSAQNCGACHRACASGEVCSHGYTCQGKDCFEVTEIEGNVKLADNGGLTLHSDPSTQDYGAFAFKVPNATTFGDLTSIETDFDFADGSSCGAGSPRFAISFKSISKCYLAAQIPPAKCSAPNSSGNSGNLIGDNTPYDWTTYGGSRFCPTVTTYDQALNEFGDQEIDTMFVVLDSSNNQPQTVTLKPCITTSAQPQ